MKTHIYLTLRYWQKHKKNAAALLFAGVLLTAIMFVTLMSKREESVRFFHEVYDAYGHYDVLIADSNDEILAKATEGHSGYDYGVMYVYGKMGYAGNLFEYGTIEDEHNIWHIPLDEGRMPETSDEIAAVRTVLDACYWVGKCGDTITLDDKTYTVVGIISEDYGKWRIGSSLEIAPYTFTEDSPYKIPLIFVGASNEEPLYRMDMLGSFFDLRQDPEIHEREVYEYNDLMQDLVGYETRWFDVTSERMDGHFDLYVYKSPQIQLFMIIAWIGAVISVLSVFSVLRTVFTERRSNIETLKRIGMKKSGVGKLYAVEGVIFSAVQIVLGIAFGLAVYHGILLFKFAALGEAPYSGLTPPYLVYERTPSPFLWAAVISSVISVIAYILNALTVNVKRKIPDKNRKPASLSRCFGRVFRQRGVTAVQTASLFLICLSVLFGYVYLTDNGKELTDWVLYMPSVSYTVNDFNMEDEGIAEYYSSSTPMVGGHRHMDNDFMQGFPVADAGYTEGIGDEIAEQLPDYALVTGQLTQTFISSDEPKASYGAEIDLSNEIVRQGLLEYTVEEYQDFFEEGNLGTKHMYRVFTKLTSVRNIKSLAESVVEGEINIDALNRGEEILVAYQGRKPWFKVGETVTVNSVGGAEAKVHGIGSINSAEVKIGAILQIYPGIGAVKNYTIRSDQEYNFLTTATGADAMGLHCARYTEIYSSEPMDGSIIPSSAEMRLVSLEARKREEKIKKAKQYGASILILLVMSLLGFAAYFNGIGMKIRLRAYDISVMRAVGAPVSEVRRRLLLNSIKIPLIASALAYGVIKTMQFTMEKAYVRMMELFDEVYSSGAWVSLSDSRLKKPYDLRKYFLLDNVMWQVNTEIPALILFVVICAVTFILTTIALKKFRGNIAGDLNEGRKRR